MPLFRTQPSSSLSSSIANLIAGSGGLSAVDEGNITHRAARTARELTLLDKARMEAQALRDAQAFRQDPANATRYATHSAGLDEPTGNRLMGALRGAMEQPSGADYEDNPNVQPFPMQSNVDPQKRAVFQNAIATTIGNLLATGKSNVESMADATNKGVRTSILSDAARAAARGDVAGVNLLSSGVLSGREQTPFKLGPQGQVIDEWRGPVNEQTQLAQAFKKLKGAQASQAGAAAGLSSARAEKVRSGADIGAVSVVKKDAQGNDMIVDGRPVLELVRRDQAVGRTPAPREFRPGVEGASKAADVWRKNRVAARKDYDALPLKERKAQNFEAYFDNWLKKVPGGATPPKPASAPDATFDKDRGIWTVTRNGKKFAVVEDEDDTEE